MRHSSEAPGISTSCTAHHITYMPLVRLVPIHFATDGRTGKPLDIQVGRAHAINSNTNDVVSSYLWYLPVATSPSYRKKRPFNHLPSPRVHAMPIAKVPMGMPYSPLAPLQIPNIQLIRRTSVTDVRWVTRVDRIPPPHAFPPSPIGTGKKAADTDGNSRTSANGMAGGAWDCSPSGALLLSALPTTFF